MGTPKEQRCWYMQESEKIISKELRDELVEILKVWDSACALYATATRQTSPAFPGSDVIAWLDRESKKRRLQ